MKTTPFFSETETFLRSQDDYTSSGAKKQEGGGKDKRKISFPFSSLRIKSGGGAMLRAWKRGEPNMKNEPNSQNRQNQNPQNSTQNNNQNPQNNAQNKKRNDAQNKQEPTSRF